VHLLPFIIVLLAWLLAIAGGIFFAILLSNRNKKIAELCRAGKYTDSIVLAKKQLNYYQRTLKNKNTKSVIETIYLLLAISYLGLSNDEQFIHNITQIDDDNSEKHFWLALFYLLKKDLTKFQTQYDILSSKSINENYLSYLSSIKKLQECDDADARVILSDLKSRLNFKLLQDIAEKIVDQ